MMPPTAGELVRMNELHRSRSGAGALDAIVSGRIAKINQSLAGTPHHAVEACDTVEGGGRGRGGDARRRAATGDAQWRTETASF
jgi:hypothetical protein